jgi:fatty acid desaturase
MKLRTRSAAQIVVAFILTLAAFVITALIIAFITYFDWAIPFLLIISGFVAVWIGLYVWIKDADERNS